MVAAAIFDVDELLVSLEPQHKEAERLLVEEMGGRYADLPHEIRTASGRRVWDGVADIHAHFGWTRPLQEVFDRRQGLFSLPSRTSVATALWVSGAMHVGTVLLLAVLPRLVPLGALYGAGLALVALLLAWEHSLVRPSELSRVNAAFFMGLFFLISAYFVPSSFERKGTWTFLKDRFLRLGIPFALVGCPGCGASLGRCSSSDWRVERRDDWPAINP